MRVAVPAAVLVGAAALIAGTVHGHSVEAATVQLSTADAPVTTMADTTTTTTDVSPTTTDAPPITDAPVSTVPAPPTTAAPASVVTTAPVAPPTTAAAAPVTVTTTTSSTIPAQVNVGDPCTAPGAQSHAANWAPVVCSVTRAADAPGGLRWWLGGAGPGGVAWPGDPCTSGNFVGGDGRSMSCENGHMLSHS